MLPEVEVQGGLQPRIQMLTGLEAMVNVGCKFGPNDLAPDQWRDLIILAEERGWMDARVREKEETLRTEARKADAAMTEARKTSGVPPPGQSLFAGRKR